MLVSFSTTAKDVVNYCGRKKVTAACSAPTALFRVLPFKKLGRLAQTVLPAVNELHPIADIQCATDCVVMT